MWHSGCVYLAWFSECLTTRETWLAAALDVSWPEDPKHFTQPHSSSHWGLVKVQWYPLEFWDAWFNWCNSFGIEVKKKKSLLLPLSPLSTGSMWSFLKLPNLGQSWAAAMTVFCDVPVRYTYINNTLTTFFLLWFWNKMTCVWTGDFLNAQSAITSEPLCVTRCAMCACLGGDGIEGSRVTLMSRLWPGIMCLGEESTMVTWRRKSTTLTPVCVVFLQPVLDQWPQKTTTQSGVSKDNLCSVITASRSTQQT